MSDWLVGCYLRLLEWSTPPGDRDTLIGDLTEELEELESARLLGGRPVPDPSLGRLRRRVANELVASLAPNLRRRLRDAFGGGASRHRSSGEPMMALPLQDLRFALRSHRRRPALAALVILTIGLGIGAQTLILGTVDGVLFNQLPYPEASRLVGIGPVFPKLGRELSFFEVLSPAEFVEIGEQSETLDKVVAWDMGYRQFSIEGGEPETLLTAFWWGDALDTLGVTAVAGRGMSEQEMAEGHRVVVLSHRLWLRSFAGDHDVVGQSVQINGQPYEVVGIMPDETSLYGSDLWIPMGIGPEVFPRGRRMLQVLARIRDGASLKDVNTELATIAGRLAAEYGEAHEEYEGWRLIAETWRSINVRSLRPVAWTTLGAAAFVMLLVCANVANLLLGRAAKRGEEIGVRQALGAARSRLIWQLLAESLMLAVTGGALGVALAALGVKALAAGVASLSIPFLPIDIELNSRVLLLAFGIAVAAGVLFGLAPALHASGRSLSVSGAARALGSAGRHRLQRTFVALQVALATVLLFGGGLLIHSFVKLQQANPGFASEDLLSLRITLPWERYEGESIRDFFVRLEEQVEGIPGVESAAVASQFAPNGFMRRRFEIEGAPPTGDDALPTALASMVSPSLFRTMGIPLQRGRGILDTDIASSPQVVVLNELAAERFFPGTDPLGQRLRVHTQDGDVEWHEIVGVVATVKNRGLEQRAEPEVFASTLQLDGSNQFFVLVRTAVDPAVIVDSVRSEVRALDPQQGLYAVQTIDQMFAREAAPRRFVTVLLLSLSVFAVLLAAVGIYAVISNTVAERTREIGLRMALGAARGSVQRWALHQALLPVGVGAVIGLAGSLAVSRLIQGVLFEVEALDPLTLVATPMLLALAAVIAGWLPARRASQLDPVTALRLE